MKTQGLSPELTIFAEQIDERWRVFMEPILIHVNEKLPALYNKCWRMVPQILLAISPDSVIRFLRARRRIPRSFDQLFEFWNDHGGSDYYRLLEETFQQMYEEENFEQVHEPDFLRILQEA